VRPILGAASFLALIGCAGPPLDVALRGSAAATPAEPPDAPFFVYDLVLAVDALDTERWDAHFSSLCDRTGDEIDVLLGARGFRPESHESDPQRPWVRLTLLDRMVADFAAPMRDEQSDQGRKNNR
jgi:hypothetical protein